MRKAWQLPPPPCKFLLCGKHGICLHTYLKILLCGETMAFGLPSHLAQPFIPSLLLYSSNQPTFSCYLHFKYRLTWIVAVTISLLSTASSSTLTYLLLLLTTDNKQECQNMAVLESRHYGPERRKWIHRVSRKASHDTWVVSPLLHSQSVDLPGYRKMMSNGGSRDAATAKTTKEKQWRYHVGTQRWYQQLCGKSIWVK